MPRVKLDLPEHFMFQTRVKVRISDINYGGHLGNDAVLSIMHEGRMQFMAWLGFAELDVEGLGIILADSVVVYKSEAFHGDDLTVEVTAEEFNKYGCDLFYRLSNRHSGVEVARAKTGVVFFDYEARKVAAVPPAFLARIEHHRREASKE